MISYDSLHAFISVNNFSFWAIRRDWKEILQSVTLQTTKRIPAFITPLCDKTYTLLRNLTAPAKPSLKSYAELTTLLKIHLSLKPLTISERFPFHERSQLEWKTVTQYLAELCYIIISFWRHLSRLHQDRLQKRNVIMLKFSGQLKSSMNTYLAGSLLW